MPQASTFTEETSGLSRMVLSDQVKQHILDCIERGVYKPGERLVESQLARQLRTSQAPVREAIRDLVSAGFLAREPHRGAVVRMLTDEDLHEIYIVRAPLDALAAEQATPHITDAHLRTLTEITENMFAAARAQDFISAARLDGQFHMLIVDLAGNKLLRRIYDSLQLGQYILITMRRSSLSLESLVARHEAVMQALKTHDPAVAREAMREHIAGLYPLH